MERYRESQRPIRKKTNEQRVRTALEELNDVPEELRDPNWPARAACRMANPEIFTNSRLITQAREICAHCWVRPECLTNALERQEEGFWGGLSRSQRDYLEELRHEMPEQLAS